MNVRKSLLIYLLCAFLVVDYLFLIWGGFRSSLLNISSIFGYLDYQNNWRALEDFLRFKVPFKDYFFEYGWFFLFIQAPGYLLFGQNFLAILISRHLYLPILAVALSYIVAKNILGKKYLILIFLFFALLFGTNYDFTSLRHLMAELSLSFFILYLLKNKDKYLLISGIIGGLAVLTALEYGVALNLVILSIFLFSFLSEVKLKKYFFNKFLVGQLTILAPYFFWLYIKGALGNYWGFTSGFMKNFYYVSPCSGDSFPRLSEIQTLAPVSKLMVFNIPLEFLQRVNLYLVFIFYVLCILVLLVLFIKNKKFKKNDLAKLSLVAYGLLIFTRTLDNPCPGYFTYGLVPFFLLITLLIGEIISWSWRKKLFVFKIIGFSGIILIFFWFILTEETGYVIKIFGKEEKHVKKESYAEEFYSPVGWFMRKDFVKDYRQISDYIVANTTKDDFLYVYPWGPYNNLTGRKPPNSFTYAPQASVAGEQFVEMARKELEIKKPKLVVINIYNNLGIAHYGKTRGDITRYFSLGFEDGPVFAGEGNEVEKYILENYETVLHNNVAIVMIPRLNRLKIKENKKVIYLAENWQEENVKLEKMVKKGENGEYAVKGKNASWALTFDQPLEAEDIAIEFKLDGNLLTKHFTRYFLNFYITVAGEEKSRQIKDLATKERQIKKIPFVKPEKITTIKLEIGEKSGLIWWLNPDRLEVKKVTILGRR